jgi:glycosyltransferase involved in cell wall biosynthesis
MINKYNKNKVTICIPSFNSKLFIKKTVESILSQNFKNYDIFFFDNCSTDNTKDIIDHYISRFSNFRKFIRKKNIIGENHINKILKKKNLFGEYFCIFHSDDIYDKNILNLSINFLKKNLDCCAVSSTANIIDINDNIYSKTLLPKEISNKKFFKLDISLFHKFLFEGGNFLVSPSFVFRTKSFILNDYKYKYKKYKKACDVDFFNQILEKEKIAIINKNLLNYRISNYSFTGQDLEYRTKDSHLFLVLNDILKGYKYLDYNKYLFYLKKFKFLLMIDRARQLINSKSLKIKSKIILNISDNLITAFESYKNIKYLIYILFIRIFIYFPFSRFIIKKIIILRRHIYLYI